VISAAPNEFSERFQAVYQIGRNACATFQRQECLWYPFPQAGMSAVRSFGKKASTRLGYGRKESNFCKKLASSAEQKTEDANL